MTNEEKIAELIKVSKMPSEERIAYIKRSIAKSKMKNTINEDNENDEGPIQIGDNPDEFYRKLGAIPFNEFAENIYSFKPDEKIDMEKQNTTINGQNESEMFDILQKLNDYRQKLKQMNPKDFTPPSDYFQIGETDFKLKMSPKAKLGDLLYILDNIEEHVKKHYEQLLENNNA